METISFRNRIALYYIISTALLIGAACIVIFLVVQINVTKHLDKDLLHEVERHSKAITIKNGSIALKSQREWIEREHNTISVDPVFIEFLDKNGHIIDKSPNLRDSHLRFNCENEDKTFRNQRFTEKRIRQVQVIIKDANKQKAGYLIVAISREGYEIVLSTLKHILGISYLFILIILFLVARFLAGRSIKPINNIISISNKITRDNLTTRIPLPHNKDELYILSQTINQLLERIEKAIDREKSFTSYASHEFRTPLAVLKGTLEVLIRKPRQTEEYEEKINYCIQEIDRLNHLVDDLLTLTRFENIKQSIHADAITVDHFIKNSLTCFAEQIKSKNIKTEVSINPDSQQIKTDLYLFSTIFNNILSNAIKYSNRAGLIKIYVYKQNNQVVCTVEDEGTGIAETDIDRIFDKFYRSRENNDIKGFGLGLPIVKRFCTILNIELTIQSKKEKGTIVQLKFPQS